MSLQGVFFYTLRRECKQRRILWEAACIRADHCSAETFKGR